MVELWTQREDIGPPPQAAWARLDYDRDRGVAVLLGWPPVATPRAHTWEWDGSVWVQVDDMGPPPWCTIACMSDQQAVLALSYASFARQTWERKNAQWTQVSDTGANPAGGLVYDDSRSRAITMGFSSPATGFLETWEWDGAAWTLVADTGPSTRSDFAMTYDATNKVTVLFGGIEYTTWKLLRDTWIWNGTQWKQASDMGPAARGDAGFTHDATKGRSLLFGGTDWTVNPLILYGDTWGWDGTLWRQLSDMGPTPRTGVGLCYDRDRQHAVLFGGWASAQALGDTWEYFDHT